MMFILHLRADICSVKSVFVKTIVNACICCAEASSDALITKSRSKKESNKLDLLLLLFLKTAVNLEKVYVANTQTYKRNQTASALRDVDAKRRVNCCIYEGGR